MSAGDSLWYLVNTYETVALASITGGAVKSDFPVLSIQSLTF